MRYYVQENSEQLFEQLEVSFDSTVVRQLIEQNERKKMDIGSVLLNMDMLEYDAEKERYELTYLEIDYTEKASIENELYEAIIKFGGELLIKPELLVPDKFTNALRNPSYGIDRQRRRLFVYADEVGVKGIRATSDIKKLIYAYLKHHDVDANQFKEFHEIATIEKKYKRTLQGSVESTCYISTNYYDILRMSNGNSWRSCHHLQDGEYRAGTLSYANDSATAILYKESSFDDTELVARAMLYIVPTGFYLSKWYGDVSKKDNMIKALKRAIKRSYEVTGSDVRVQSYDYSRGFHYPDYNYNDGNLELNVDLPIDTMIGNTSYCLKCGDEIDYAEEVHCDYCKEDAVFCKHCGERIDIDYDDYVIVDDEYYCSDCATYCSECGEGILIEDYYTHDTPEGYMCDYCYDNNYTTCDACGCEVEISEVVNIDFMSYCPECADELQDERNEVKLY